MSSADAGAGAGAGADDVLDARETLADGGKRLARALRGPFARAQPHWKSFAQLTFACPTASEVPGRVKKNLQQFGYCYVSLAAALAAYNALSRALLAVMLAGAFIGHHYVARVRRAPIEIGGRVFGAKTQGVACAAATAIFFWKFITDVFFSAMTSVAHAVRGRARGDARAGTEDGRGRGRDSVVARFRGGVQGERRQRLRSASS